MKKWLDNPSTLCNFISIHCQGGVVAINWFENTHTHTQLKHNPSCQSSFQVCYCSRNESLRWLKVTKLYINIIKDVHQRAYFGHSMYRHVCPNVTQNLYCIAQGR